MPDTIGGVNSHIGNIHKYAREEDRPEKTIFVITTVAMENASHQYSYDRVRQMVKRQKEKYSHEFLFPGANIDAIKTAGRFGISADRAANHPSSHEDTKRNYEVFRMPTAKHAAAQPRSGAAGKTTSKRTSKSAGRKTYNLPS